MSAQTSGPSGEWFDGPAHLTCQVRRSVSTPLAIVRSPLLRSSCFSLLTRCCSHAVAGRCHCDGVPSSPPLWIGNALKWFNGTETEEELAARAAIVTSYLCDATGVDRLPPTH